LSLPFPEERRDNFSILPKAQKMKRETEGSKMIGLRKGSRVPQKNPALVII
jgi:hypothetical protein